MTRLAKTALRRARAAMLSAAVISIGLAGVAQAAIVNYDCTLKRTGRSNIVPPRVILSLDTASGQAQVIDGIIKHYVGKPLPAVVKSENDTRILFAWVLPGVKDTRGQYIPHTDYSLNIIKATGKASLAANPRDRRYMKSHGTGTCTKK